jgi:hypothetical protein
MHIFLLDIAKIICNEWKKVYKSQGVRKAKVKAKAKWKFDGNHKNAVKWSEVNLSKGR